MRIMSELPLEGEAPVHCVSGADMCELLGISPAMLTELKRRGIARHVGRDAWDLEATVNAYVTHLRGIASGRGGEAHVLELTAERARLAKAQADAQELRNAQAHGELIRAEDAEREWFDLLRQLRARLLAIPARLRSDGALDREASAALDRALRDALAELGGGDA